MTEPDMSKLTPAECLQGQDAEDTALLKDMLRDAGDYLRSHEWCPEVTERYFAFGVGRIVAVFLFRFAEKINGTDDTLWVIVGDLPSAYLVSDDIPDATSALENYCELMEEWASAALTEEPLENTFPVGAEPTVENAEALKSRTAFLRSEIIPISRC